MAITKQGLEAARRSKRPLDDADLHTPPYLNGFVLTLAGIFVLIGICVIVPPVVSESLYKNWPWPKYGLLLIALLCVTLLSLVTLFHQQKFVKQSHERYEKAKTAILEHSQHNVDRLFALLEVSHMIGTAAELQTLFDHITNSCGKVFDCHQASLMLYDKKRRELVVKSVGGKAATDDALGARVALGSGIAGWAAQEDKPLLLERDCRPDKYPGLQLRSDTINAAMVVPIRSNETLVGVINVSTRSREVNYDQADLRALQVFAEAVGVRIQHLQEIVLLKHTIRKLEDAARSARQGVPAGGPDSLQNI